MEATDKRLIDVMTIELSQLIEDAVGRVLDARLPKQPPKYYTVTEVSKMLDISRVTLYRLKNEGKLPYRRMAGTNKIRLIQEDIDLFILKNPGFTVKHNRMNKAT